MTQKVQKFSFDKNTGIAEWEYNGQRVSKTFSGETLAYYASNLDQVLVVADPQINGPNNIFIYNPGGTLNMRPNMPTLSKPVNGVYAVWFIDNNIEQETILLSGEYNPYDTGCTFNLKTGQFYNFHPSK